MKIKTTISLISLIALLPLSLGAQMSENPKLKRLEDMKAKVEERKAEAQINKTETQEASKEVEYLPEAKKKAEEKVAKMPKQQKLKKIEEVEEAIKDKKGKKDKKASNKYGKSADKRQDSGKGSEKAQEMRELNKSKDK